MGMLDKYIKMNFGYVSNDFGISGICAAAVMLCLIFLNLFPLAAFFIAVSMLFLVKAYKKLFSEGLYGERAALERTLPVSEEEVVFTKVFVAAIGRIIFGIALSTAIIFGYKMSIADLHLSGMLVYLVPESVTPGALPAAVALKVLMTVTTYFFQTAVILLCVIWYHHQKKQGSAAAWKVVASAGGLLLCCVPALINYITEGINAISADIISIAADFVLTVLLCRVSAKLLKEKYEIE